MVGKTPSISAKDPLALTAKVGKKEKDKMCLCVNRNTRKPCAAKALKGLPVRMCSRHFKDRVIVPETDEARKIMMCAFRRKRMKQAAVEQRE